MSGELSSLFNACQVVAVYKLFR
jgi:hypothetical protein